MTWKEEAVRLYVEYYDNPVIKNGQKVVWGRLIPEMLQYFPNKDYTDVLKTVRGHVRNTNAYKERHHKAVENASVSYSGDGTIVSTKFLHLREGEELEPKEMLELHGLNPAKWKIEHCINNVWNSQLKGGGLQISYQSKLTAKPIKNGIDFADIKKNFAELDRTYKIPNIVPRKASGNVMAEVNIADLHVGKFCWGRETGIDYDYKIARDMFYSIIGEIRDEIKRADVEYILFCWANDFFHYDTVTNETTAGTRQDTDTRWKKLYKLGTEMLVGGVDVFREVAPVKTFYSPSNHDEITAFHALENLRSWFRGQDDVTVYENMKHRYYHQYGKSLIGFCHGANEGREKASNEKASRLASVMPNEAMKLWGETLFHEMHVGHLHSEQMIQEINGVIVRRIASPTATDEWHASSAYIGNVRKAQTFLWHNERGLLHTINTPV